MLNLIKGFSPRYAPPEVFARLHLRYATHTVEDDMASDCYSLGALIWEIVARQVRLTTCVRRHDACNRFS